VAARAFRGLDSSDVDPRLPLVVVRHGLEGSARSTYVLQSYRALRARDILAGTSTGFDET
jgi:predicted alpha/beta-fold hydrolase